MNVVDSSGWLESFAAGPDAGFFASPLGNPAKLVVPSTCILEVLERACQQRDEQAVPTEVAAMQPSRMGRSRRGPAPQRGERQPPASWMRIDFLRSSISPSVTRGIPGCSFALS